VLLFDLAEDGCLGKAKFVAPNYAAKVSIAAADHQSAKVYFKVDHPSPDGWAYHCSFQISPDLLGIVHYYKLSGFYTLSSSGGLPL
jgi:hypothetical protein